MPSPIKVSLGLGLALWTAPLAAQVSEAPGADPVEVFALNVSSGLLAGSGEAPRLAFEHAVHVPAADWMWLRLDQTQLGLGSHVALLSPSSGGYQVLDRQSLPHWNQRTAIFGGDTVLVQLWVAPEDPGSELILSHAIALLNDPGAGKSLCGSDNRVASSDNRIGRLTPASCSGWRVTNGAMLTAGHCGGLVGNVLEFNVPSSLADGTKVPSDPSDQYPVDSSSVINQNSIGVGDDWSLFAVGPNSNTGLLPHEAYGLPLRVTQSVPTPSVTTRVTGFGLDVTPPGSTGGKNSQNATDQTATGPFDELTIVDPDTVYVRYFVDTEGGNSGSPVLWNAQDVAFAVHTSSGCSSSQGNAGTSFLASDLASVLNNFRGPSAVYVDRGHPLAASPNGSVFRPYPDFSQGVNAVAVGGVVSLVAGNYSAGPGNSITITKALLLESPTGSALIGN